MKKLSELKREIDECRKKEEFWTREVRIFGAVQIKPKKKQEKKKEKREKLEREELCGVNHVWGLEWELVNILRAVAPASTVSRQVIPELDRITKKLQEYIKRDKTDNKDGATFGCDRSFKSVGDKTFEEIKAIIRIFEQPLSHDKRFQPIQKTLQGREAEEEPLLDIRNLYR